MAVAVVMDFNGATLEEYDRVLEKMGFTAGGPGPPGALSHWVMKTDNGIRVTDLWETREMFDAFALRQIGPITVEVGFPEEPEVTYFEVHNYLTTGN